MDGEEVACSAAQPDDSQHRPSWVHNAAIGAGTVARILSVSTPWGTHGLLLIIL